MFTRLDELHDGDFMYIKVMDETLGYEVDRISVIEPDDVSRLKIVPGEDRLTLMTCTPYGINTHRLLVRASRRNTAARARSGRRARRTRDRTGRARHDHRLHDGRHAVVLHGRAVDAAPTPNHAARFHLAA